MINKLKVFFLFSLIIILFFYAGKILAGFWGAISGLLLGLTFNYILYIYSDKMIFSFYNAKPLPYQSAPEIHEILRELTQRAKIPKPKLYIIPSSHPNIFSLGVNLYNSSLVLTYGILNLLSLRELKGVIAHEISHIKERDTLLQTIIAGMARFFSLLTQFFRWIFLFGNREERYNLKEDFFFLLFSPILALLIKLNISETREYSADENAAYLIKDPETLADALLFLAQGIQRHPLMTSPATHHLFIVQPVRLNGFLSGMFSTHPPLQARIDRLRKMVEVE